MLEKTSQSLPNFGRSNIIDTRVKRDLAKPCTMFSRTPEMQWSTSDNVRSEFMVGHASGEMRSKGVQQFVEHGSIALVFGVAMMECIR